MATEEANGRSRIAGPAMVLESSTIVVLEVDETTAYAIPCRVDGMVTIMLVIGRARTVRPE